MLKTTFNNIVFLSCRPDVPTTKYHSQFLYIGGQLDLCCLLKSVKQLHILI